jgi:hypothetical protein
MVAKYRVLEKTFVAADGHLTASLREPGEEIEFSGRPNRAMEPLNDQARIAMNLVRAVSFEEGNILPRRGQPASITDTDGSV